VKQHRKRDSENFSRILKDKVSFQKALDFKRLMRPNFQIKEHLEFYEYLSVLLLYLTYFTQEFSRIFLFI
jgi:hypothetical protein